MEHHAREILATGVDYYLTKPLKKAALEEYILVACPEDAVPPMPVALAADTHGGRAAGTDAARPGATGVGPTGTAPDGGWEDPIPTTSTAAGAGLPGVSAPQTSPSAQVSLPAGGSTSDAGFGRDPEVDASHSGRPGAPLLLSDPVASAPPLFRRRYDASLSASSAP
jgi:hypothetical protein